MDPRYMDNLEKNTFKLCTPTRKKCEIKDVRSQPIGGCQIVKF